jgi:hypothetical protein
LGDSIFADAEIVADNVADSCSRGCGGKNSRLRNNKKSLISSEGVPVKPGQNIIRTTSILSRSLHTEGTLRNVSRSDNNPHGFLIERFNTIENKDLGTINRKP